VTIDPATVSVPVLGHFGRKDNSIPVDGIRRLAAQVEAAGGSFQAYFYEAGHAFFNDTRPQAYNADAAALAWERTLAFLREKLGGE
jgi:carboxymethylenebutenolidase